MIIGRKSYVHVKFDRDGDIASIWGPFPTLDDATNWSGIPGEDSGSGQIVALHSPPQWFDEEEGVAEDTDLAEDEIHGNE